MMRSTDGDFQTVNLLGTPEVDGDGELMAVVRAPDEKKKDNVLARFIISFSALPTRLREQLEAPRSRGPATPRIPRATGLDVLVIRKRKATRAPTNRNITIEVSSCSLFFF